MNESVRSARRIYFRSDGRGDGWITEKKKHKKENCVVYAERDDFLTLPQRDEITNYMVSWSMCVGERKRRVGGWGGGGGVLRVKGEHETPTYRAMLRFVKNKQRNIWKRIMKRVCLWPFAADHMAGHNIASPFIRTVFFTFKWHYIVYSEFFGFMMCFQQEIFD